MIGILTITVAHKVRHLNKPFKLQAFVSQYVVALDIVGHPGAPEWAQYSGPRAGRGLHDILVSAAKYHLHAFIYDFTISSDTMPINWSYLSLTVKTGWTTKSVWGHKLRDSLLHRATRAPSNKKKLCTDAILMLQNPSPLNEKTPNCC